MTEKRFTINNDMTLDNKVETYELSCIVDNSNKTFYFIVDSIANVESFIKRLNELYDENQQLHRVIEENEQLKKALWCIRKRYGYTIEEFVEDLKDNGTDLSKVDLE